MEISDFNLRIKEYLSLQFNLPEGQIDSMLPAFKETLTEHMVNLETANESGGLQGIEKAAHKIKGAFLNLGLTDCADLALKIEVSASQRESSIDYSALISQINKIVEEIVKD